MPVVGTCHFARRCAVRGTFEFKLESGIDVYQVKKESKGKQGTENYVTNLEGS